MSTATLPALDSSLYPQVWEEQTFDSPQKFLLALLMNKIEVEPKNFTKLLQANNTYQEWVNASIFGRYIQRSFAAIYHQSEDSFNMDVPALFLNELKRHGQYLPLEQILFVSGDMPKKARRDKLFTTTINPATVIVGAQKLNAMQPIINQIQVKAKQVLSFPIRHNKRTSERTRNEILILGFNDLRLVNEETIKKSNTESTVLLRYYELR